MDDVGLLVEFLEVNVRGSDESTCQVRVTEEGLYGCHVTDSWEFDSWGDMLEEFPTFKELLYLFFDSCNWTCCGTNDKTLYAHTVLGGEGLYSDFLESVSNLDL